MNGFFNTAVLVFDEHVGKKGASTEVTSLFKKGDRLGCSDYGNMYF
jgi:hypothetical protein